MGCASVRCGARDQFCTCRAHVSSRPRKQWRDTHRHTHTHVCTDTPSSLSCAHSVRSRRVRHFIALLENRSTIACGATRISFLSLSHSRRCSCCRCVHTRFENSSQKRTLRKRMCGLCLLMVATTASDCSWQSCDMPE